MFKSIFKITFTAAAPLFLTACNTTTTQSSSPMLSMAATTVAGVTAADILAVANGPVDWSGQNGPFPTAIVGGDGSQANQTNDASFGTLINAVRTAAGTTALTYNAQLDAAAQSHSNDMVANGYFSHTGQNGSTIASRARAAGYNFTTIGENIAQGQTNENLAMNGWISSPGHQANNVNPAFREFGLGRAGTGSNTTWTLMLGAQ
ncbi:CAP domain-containing protein [Planktotalea sp.]|uniref:CAP domain-containing protein n=1 Tax=Planktotalea sp. TaxID=2029877 RepID=UPI003F6C6521